MNRDVCEHCNPVDLPCDKCKPEALRLADALEMSSNHGIRRDAAAELRRLHAELGRCKQVCAATSESWRTDAEKWGFQRDALLSALKGMLLHMGMDEDEWNKPTFDQARAAIKAVEEGK